MSGEAVPPLDGAPDDPPIDGSLIIQALQNEVGMLVGRVHTLAASNVALRAALAQARAALAERTTPTA